jgi:uncharacterized protein DUF5615
VKFKFDENLGRAAATVLLDAGFDVVTVPEQRLERASDHDVIECCVGEERCLVTMDAEFANPLLFPPRRYRGHCSIAASRSGDERIDRRDPQIYAFRRYQDHRRYLALEREYVRRTLARLSPP